MSLFTQKQKRVEESRGSICPAVNTKKRIDEWMMMRMMMIMTNYVQYYIPKDDFFGNWEKRWKFPSCAFNNG
jgi:hypothetical protein